MTNYLRKENVELGLEVYVREPGFIRKGHFAKIEKVNSKSIIVEGNRFTQKCNGRYYRCEKTDQILYIS